MAEPARDRMDLHQILQETDRFGAIASLVSEQLNINLVRLAQDDQIAAHINADLDVLLVVSAGRGELIIDSHVQPLRSGIAVVVPRGVTRAIHCTEAPLVYMTCHRRRPGLLPT